jgi:hypothetical protein
VCQYQSSIFLVVSIKVVAISLQNYQSYNSNVISHVTVLQLCTFILVQMSSVNFLKKEYWPRCVQKKSVTFVYSIFFLGGFINSGITVLELKWSLVPCCPASPLR